jgi:hypothetical protein
MTITVSPRRMCNFGAKRFCFVLLAIVIMCWSVLVLECWSGCEKFL